MDTRDRQRAKRAAAHDVAGPGGELDPGKATLTAGLTGPGPVRASGLIQRKADANGVQTGADAAVARAGGSSGAPLPATVRRKFEGSLGADLSGVRVHTGAASAEAARAVSARAYTVGQDVHFAAGQYAPESPGGEHLLAHEVAHTVQQAGAPGPAQFKLEVSAPGDHAELDADRAADAMVAARPASLAGGQGLQRKLFRDMDKNQQEDAKDYAHAETNDQKVEIIETHTTVADQNAAAGIISTIKSVEPQVLGLAKENSDWVDMLSQNELALLKMQDYQAKVADTGDYLGEFQAAYFNSKQDYGAFTGAFAGFMNSGGNLGAAGSLFDKTQGIPGWGDAMKMFTDCRAKLNTDAQAANQAQDNVNTKQDLMQVNLNQTRQAVANASVKDKEGQLQAIQSQIDNAVSTIMMVGQVAAAAFGGIAALEGGGFDITTLQQGTEPTIEAARPAPPAPAPAAPATNPNSGAREIDMDAPAAAPAKPAAPAAPVDNTTYSRQSQVNLSSAQTLGGKAMSLAGGPKVLLTQALTMLQQADMDGIRSQILASKVDADFSAAAGAAASAAAVKNDYIAAINKLIAAVDDLMTQKANMDTYANNLVALSKKSGADPNVGGAIRIVEQGDKFLAQVSVAIRLADEEQQRGAEALDKRRAINANSYDEKYGDDEELYYWSTRTGDDGTVVHRAIQVPVKNTVGLDSGGRDSLASSNSENGTQFDVKHAAAELADWQKDVSAKRDQAQNALSIGAPGVNMAVTPN